MKDVNTLKERLIMANAYKCDACGVLYSEHVISMVSIVIDRHPYPDQTRCDLCPKCQKKLEDFIHYKEK